MPASFRTTGFSMVAPAPITMSAFAQRRKPLHRDIQQVDSRRQRREEQLASPVGYCRHPSDQRGRAEANDCTGDNATLVVLDRPDESARQALCGSDAMQQHKSHKDQQQPSLPANRASFVHLRRSSESPSLRIKGCVEPLEASRPR